MVTLTQGLQSMYNELHCHCDSTLLTSLGYQAGDWATYSSLCHPDGTCIEAETMGQVVRGLDFHKHYFDLPANPDSASAPSNITVCDLHARVCPKGVMGFVTYNRLNQSGIASSLAQETRIWEKNSEGHWKQVHFHKSVLP
jgi:hypothetical protein